MEQQLFHVMDQDAACALDHAFGKPRGAGGKHDVQGVIGGKLCEFNIRRADSPAVISWYADGIGNMADIRVFLNIGHHDHFFNGGQVF